LISSGSAIVTAALHPLWSSLRIFSLTAVRARSNRAAPGVGTGLLKATRPAA